MAVLLKSTRLLGLPLMVQMEEEMIGSSGCGWFSVQIDKPGGDKPLLTAPSPLL